MPGVYGFIKKRRKGLGLWCLTPLSTIFQLYRGAKRRKEKNRKKVIFKCNFAAFIQPSNISQDQRYCIILFLQGYLI
jgi:hypothetical protein